MRSLLSALRIRWARRSRLAPAGPTKRHQPVPEFGAPAGLEPLEPRLLLSTFVVDSLDDNTTSGDGDVTLREAIEAANNDTTVEGTTGSGADVIEFTGAATSGEIDLTNGQLPISSALTINGPGADRLAIDAQSNQRVFEVVSGAVQINALTLKNGASSAGNDQGGVLKTAGDLTLNDLTVEGGSAGQGGGIFNTSAGTLTINRSTIANNTATGDGGGVRSEGALTVTNSTVSGNSADGRGGGIAVTGGGGVTINNSTVAQNTADADGSGAGDGGGLFTAGGTSATLRSSIFADNTDADGAGDLDLTDAPAAATDNLIESGSGHAISDNSNGNIVGEQARLRDLADNGGPTLTHALKDDSPALGAGDNPNGLSEDQRGTLFDRSTSRGVDIGAYQAQSLTLTVDAASDAPDGDFTAGDLSVNEAVNQANANPGAPVTDPTAETLEDRTGADTITFDGALTDNGTPAVETVGGELTITDDLIVVGNGADAFSIGPSGTSRVLNVDDGIAGTGPNDRIEVRLEQLTVRGGDASGSAQGSDGGGLRNDEITTLDQVSVRNNTTGTFGGGIANSFNGDLTLIRSTVRGNSAANGGGIDNVGELTLRNSTVANNTADVDGGGIESVVTSNSVAELNIANSTIANNTADADTDGTGHGGGLFSDGGSETIESTILGGNTGQSGNANDIFTADGNAIETAEFNLVETNSGFSFDSSSNNILGSAPMLDTLALHPDEDGQQSQTQSYNLQDGSDALDAGFNPNGEITDQPGNRRTFDLDGTTNAAGSDATDIGAFERVPAGAEPQASVVGRHLYYNGSSFDNNDEAINSDDDNAIAPAEALLQGQTADTSNIDNFIGGIKGIMVDVEGLAEPGSITASDFQFQVGNKDDVSTWSPAPAPDAVDVRQGAGVNGSDRIAATWNAGRITNTWLQVRLQATTATGLPSDSVFYYGNAAGDATGDGETDIVDIGQTRLNQTGFGSADIDNAFDINRDEDVNIIDIVTVRQNQSGFSSVKSDLTPSDGSGTSSLQAEPISDALAADSGSGDSTDSQLSLAWSARTVQSGGQSESGWMTDDPEDNDRMVDLLQQTDAVASGSSLKR